MQDAGAVADMPPAVLCLQTSLSFACSFVPPGTKHLAPTTCWAPSRVPDQRGLVPALPVLIGQMRPPTPHVLCVMGEQGSWKAVAPTLGPEGWLEGSQQRATGRVCSPEGTARVKPRVRENMGHLGRLRRLEPSQPPKGRGGRSPWGAGVVALPFWETKDHKKVWAF